MILQALLLAASLGAMEPYCPPQVVDTTTLEHKLMLGYQGWFGAPGDGSQSSSWYHWFGGPGEAPLASRANFDLFPDLSEAGPKEIFPTQISGPDAKPMGVYSAYTWATVARHFKWMRDYGIDGVMLQRFSGETRLPRFFDFRNRVTTYVMGGASYYGRTFCIMYDISGDQSPDESIIKDWKYLVDVLKVTQSPRYLRHKGKPLVAVWGIGFSDRTQSPETARRIIDFFKNNPNPAYRATLMGGVPAQWRTLSGASRPEASWRQIYESLEVISPWTVGQYGNTREADGYMRSTLSKDLAVTKRNGQDYMPVIWPGFSWHNMKKAKLNQVPRMGGTFYWRQFYNAMSSDCSMIYNAMFDEVDEGTAMYKVLASKTQLPPGGNFLSLDADGDSYPSDWYLRLAGMANRTLRGDLKLDDNLPLDRSKPKESDGAFRCPATTTH